MSLLRRSRLGCEGRTRAALAAVLVLATLLALAATASAQGAARNGLDYTTPTDGLFTVPGGPGWTRAIVSFWWLVPIVAVSGLLLWVIQWIDADARRVKLDPLKWNYGGIVLALASLVAFVLLPPWLSLPAVLAAVLAVVWNYIPLRNTKALPTRRLFTPEHRQALKTRALAKIGLSPASVQKRLEKLALEHVPVAVFDARGRILSPADAPFDESDSMAEVKEIVGEAIKRHAREVEIVPRAGQVTVSYVIDGLSHAGPTFDRLVGNAAMLLIKKKLIDAASAAPQFRVQSPTLGNRAFTVRTCVYGEGDAEWMRLRLLPDDESMRKFEQLGISDGPADMLRAALDSGRGLLAVASPAAMGSHTTIYALLDTLDPFSRNILTYERPVAGKIDSVVQQEFTDGAALAGVLRDVVRKDVDLVMLSELPDAATAEVALSAAARDQLFIVRFEAPDAASIPGRIIRLGAPPADVAKGVHTLVAQRLVRRLCPSCRRKVEPPVAILQKVGIDPSQVEYVWEESAGCEECGQTGFHGRTGIFEVWQPSAESRRLIERNASVHELHASALSDGMHSLQMSGLALVLDGTTSLRELARALKVV